jgi:hypothetical protein
MARSVPTLRGACAALISISTYLQSNAHNDLYNSLFGASLSTNSDTFQYNTDSNTLPTLPIFAHGVLGRERPLTETAPVETKAVPVDTKTVPVDTKAVPVDTKAVPLDTKTVPVDTKAVPVEGKPAALRRDPPSEAAEIAPAPSRDDPGTPTLTEAALRRDPPTDSVPSTESSQGDSAAAANGENKL